MIVPLLALSDEERWLVSEVRSAVGEDILWRVLEPMLRVLPSEGRLVIASESTHHPRLRALLSAAVARLGPRQCLLVLWAVGQHHDLRPLRRYLPETVLYLPAEADQVPAWAWAPGPQGLEDLTYYLRRDLPHALNLALRCVLEQSGNPLGPPPPCFEAVLARELKISRSNLSRRARAWGVNLPGFLRCARARWVLGRARRPEDLPEIVIALGDAGKEPLRRLLRGTAGCKPSQAWTVNPDVMTGPLLEALGPAADFCKLVERGRQAQIVGEGTDSGLRGIY